MASTSRRRRNTDPSLRTTSGPSSNTRRQASAWLTVSLCRTSVSDIFDCDEDAWCCGVLATGRRATHALPRTNTRTGWVWAPVFPGPNVRRHLQRTRRDILRRYLEKSGRFRCHASGCLVFSSRGISSDCLQALLRRADLTIVSLTPVTYTRISTPRVLFSRHARTRYTQNGYTFGVTKCRLYSADHLRPLGRVVGALNCHFICPQNLQGNLGQGRSRRPHRHAKDASCTKTGTGRAKLQLRGCWALVHACSAAMLERHARISGSRVTSAA